MAFAKGRGKVMRNVLVLAATAAVILVALIGLRWFDLVTQGSAVFGFVTGVGGAVVIIVANARKTSG
jgi:hypothetical protein